jgi:hypothetical protein
MVDFLLKLDGLLLLSVVHFVGSTFLWKIDIVKKRDFSSPLEKKFHGLKVE